jgi:hypothetical protein
MNTPRQPNARPGIVPFLGQSQNVVASSAPRSFVAPVAPQWTPAAAGETSSHLTGGTSASDVERNQAQRCDSHNAGIQSS